MPRPTTGTTLQRPDLRPGMEEYMEADVQFIGIKVAPIIEVTEQAADYPVIPLEALLSMPKTSRAPRGRYNRSDYEFETDTYSCSENAWEEPVDDVEVKLYRNYFDAEQVAVNRALGIVRRAQEKRIADMLFNASNFTANAITNEWDDGANAVPYEDIAAGHLEIMNATGLRANTLIIAYSTYLDLGNCDSLIDRIAYTNKEVVRGQLSVNLLAEAFSVDQVLVGMTRYNSAKKGQTASLASIWDNEYAMLCRVSDSPDVVEPNVARTFLWTGDSPDGLVNEYYRDETIRGDVHRVRQNTDEEIILTACGYLFSNVTT